MKTYIINLFLLPALIAGLNLIPTGRVSAQTFTTLHSFNGGSDGARPLAGLILSGNTLYGTAFGGGNPDVGTVFAVSTNGTGFTNLHSFTAVSGSSFTNSDGANPDAGLILSGNTLYGTAEYGGSGNGTVFAVNTNGTGFTTLHSFTASSTNSSGVYTNSDGSQPVAGLILSGNTLYGTASAGGSSGDGTVFAVHTDGTGFTNLHIFTATSGTRSTNSDGSQPLAGLILSGNTLYGTAYNGGSGAGTVFAVNTDGTGFTNLHSFTYYSGSDGANPWAGLILSGNTLYGTAVQAGSSYGTVFAVHTDGTGFTTLHGFTGDSDGGAPHCGLILSGNTLYGTAQNGGSSGHGTVFAVNTDGTGFTTVYSFTGGSDGSDPLAGLILSGNTLYGTAESGGSSGHGTVFSLTLPPPSLNIALTGNQSVLFWSASATNYILQSTTNLASPNWVTASDAVPVIAFTVTNTSPARFFRLQ